MTDKQLPCLVSGCRGFTTGNMGDWCNFCERCWFALPARVRMELFDTYRANGTHANDVEHFTATLSAQWMLRRTEQELLK